MRELFDKLLPIFLENGGELFKFYDMTYGEINMVIACNRRRVTQEYQMSATIAYQTTRLNSYAFNDPANMPPIKDIFPGLFKEAKKKKPKVQNWKEMLMNMSAYASEHNATSNRGGNDS